MKEKSEAEKRVMKKKAIIERICQLSFEIFCRQKTLQSLNNHTLPKYIVGRFKSQFFVNSEYNTSED